jgi:hypothetical protein
MKSGAEMLRRFSSVGIMKRVSLFSLFVLAATAAFGAPSTFLWSGNHNFVLPGDPPGPFGVVDATNFVVTSGAFFGVDLTSEQVTKTFLFQTSDTLNFINNGTLEGTPGLDLEYYPNPPRPILPGVPYSSEAATFSNSPSGAIYCTNIYGGQNVYQLFGITFGGIFPINFDLPGLATLRVNATNVLDSGLIQMDNTGLIDIQGENLDLRRARFSMSGSGAVSNTTFGVTTLDAGLGLFAANGWVPAIDLTPTTATSPFFLTTLNFFFEFMQLTNSTPYFQNLTGTLEGGNIVWRGIFLQDFSPSNVVKNVYFGNSGVGGGAFHIEWVGKYRDPLTGAPATNYFYLSDVPVIRRDTNFFGLDPFTGVPTDFTFAESTTPLILGAPTAPGYVNPSPFTDVTNDFSYVSLKPNAVLVDTNLATYGSPTNLPGRIQLSANRTMNLANTRIIGPNYLLLNSPFHFQGNSNALIAAPYADLHLGVTNGSLTISNLLIPQLPAWSGLTNAPSAVFQFGLTGFVPVEMGGLQAWSGSFLFVDANGITNDVRILMVNSALNPTAPAYQKDVTLHATNDLVISDELNIFRTFSSDARILTVTSNDNSAFSLYGKLNLLSPDILWSASLPNLQYLTNFGIISTVNQAYFAGNILSPYSDINAATPYQTFINHGSITDEGTFIRANWFENSGTIQESQFGDIDIAVASRAIATNGSFIAPTGNITISANSILASNGVMNAGGTLTLTAPCYISDGYILTNQFGHITNAGLPNVVTNGNFWTANAGVRITSKPPTGDLLGTTITNIALNNIDSINEWPGNDLGCTPGGYATNLALGRMILDSDPTSQFTFVSLTGSNALYVDSIEFRDAATNTDGSFNIPSVVIQPGMKIYYAQAIMNGASVAEKLNGKNGGGFCWVSNYAGVYSSTNIFYPSDGNTYIFNEALAISPDIGSGGPDGSNTGIANINNPEPIPTNWVFDISNIGPQDCGNGGQNPNPTNPPVFTPVPLLGFPGGNQLPQAGDSNNAVNFTVALGSYNGLFYETNGVNPAHSGAFTATVTSKGGFSMKLQLGANTLSLTKSFDTNGYYSGTISNKNTGALTLVLQVMNNNEIVGTVSGKDWTAELLAEQAAFSTKTPTSWAGQDTLLLSSDEENSTAATGDGFGSVTISKTGGVQWSGTLPDGVKVSQKSALSKDGVWPVYSSLYGGAGSFIGWMQCTNDNSSTNIEGSAVWILPPGKESVYPGGLTNVLDAVGSSIGALLPAHKLVLSGGALDSSLTSHIMVVGKSVSSSDNSGLKMSFNPSTGLFSGSLMNNGQKLSFQGAVLEKSGIGGGFFLNADQSGKVYFGPAN